MRPLHPAATFVESRGKHVPDDIETPRAMLWTGRVMSGLVIAFLIFDVGIKLIGLPIVAETMVQIGWPAAMGFTIGVIEAICLVLRRAADLGARGESCGPPCSAARSRPICASAAALQPHPVRRLSRPADVGRPVLPRRAPARAHPVRRRVEKSSGPLSIPAASFDALSRARRSAPRAKGDTNDALHDAG
jgi:hypothetical protein